MHRLTLKHWDRFLGYLSKFLPARHNAKPYDRIETIAIVRLAAIGESVLTLPAIAAMKAHWPKSEITVITTPYVKPVFMGQPFIDRVYVLAPNRRMFDLVIDFEPYLYASALLARVVGKYSVGFDTLSRGSLYTKAVPYRDNQHVVQTNADLVRALGVTAPCDRLIPLSVSQRQLPVHRPFIVIAPGGRVPWRRWPADRFAQVAEALDYQIVLVGDMNDRLIADTVQRRMRKQAYVITDWKLSEIAYLFSQTHLVIANDGGLMHVSAAMGTSTLGLFGPETPLRMGPYGPSMRTLYHQLEDNPIINVSRGEVPGMLHAKGDLSRYVRAITVDEVIGTVEEMLREEGMLMTASKTSATEMARIS